MGLFDSVPQDLDIEFNLKKSGSKLKYRKPLTDWQAFRATHWLSAMAFFNVERWHVKNVGSWISKKTDYYWNTVIRQEKGKEARKLAVSTSASVLSTGAMVGIMGIGAAVGSVVPGMGTVIGAAGGLLVGAVATCACIALETAIDVRRRKVAPRHKQANHARGLRLRDQYGITNGEG